MSLVLHSWANYNKYSPRVIALKPSKNQEKHKQYEKTQGNVRKHPPIMGAAEGRPHKGNYFPTFSGVFLYLDTILVTKGTD